MQHGTLGVMHGYQSDTYGESFADVYDNWYGDVSDAPATVAKILTIASGGAVLELGVGTGRLAIPLAEAGAEVVGVDASTSMIEMLEAKPGGQLVKTIIADMAELPLRPDRFSVAFAAFNTFFNLPTEAEQIRCLERLADVIQPGGALVIEGFVPPEEGLADGGVSVRDVTLDAAVLSVSRHDPIDQLIAGQHIEINSSGVRMRPWMIHYLTPTQLDCLAATAGFVLEDRWADWADEPFDPSGETHVSVYRRPLSPTVAGHD